MERVIGIGDCVCDRFLPSHIMYPGGNALNFSVYAQMLGSDAAFLGCFGTDDVGKHIRSVLQQKQLEISHCKDIEGTNSWALLKLVDGDRVFIGEEEGIQKQFPITLNEEDLSYIKTFNHAHFGCYAYYEKNVLEKVKNTGVTISFDYSGHWRTEPDLLNKTCRFVDIAFCSCGELESEQDLWAALKMIHEMGIPIVLGTMGEKGAFLYDGSRQYRQEAYKVEPVDTIGAGDSFITAFIVHYLRNNDIEEALKKAALFSSLIVQVKGSFGYGIGFE